MFKKHSFIILGNTCMAATFFWILMRVNWDEEILKCRAIEEQEENNLKSLDTAEEFGSGRSNKESKIKSMFYKEFVNSKKDEFDGLHSIK